jgi:hypothetical protein
MKILIFVSIFLFLISCVRKNENLESSFLDKIKTEDILVMEDIIHLELLLKEINIKKLKGITIHFRSCGEHPNTNVFFLFRNDLDCSPYVIVFSNQFHKIIEIDSSLVVKFGCEDFIDRRTISQHLNDYLQLKVCYMRVDLAGNVYFNVRNQEKPDLLKVNSLSELPNDISQFRKISNDWYFRL